MPASTSESPRSVSTVGARGRSKSFPVKLTAGGARLHSRIAAFCLVRWRTRPGQIISRKADSGRRPPPLPNRRFLPRSLAHAAGANHLPQSCQRAMPATTSESPLSASSVGARGRGKSSPAKLPAGGARLHIRIAAFCLDRWRTRPGKSSPVKLPAGGARLHSRIAAFCLDRWRTRPEQIISRKAASGRCPPPLPNRRFLSRPLAYAAGANHFPQSYQRAVPASTSELPLFWLDRWRTRPEQVISRKTASGWCPPPPSGNPFALYDSKKRAPPAVAAPAFWFLLSPAYASFAPGSIASRMRRRMRASCRDTCTCVMPSSCAVCVCVLSRK